jgi:hypothetical protein
MKPAKPQAIEQPTLQRRKLLGAAGTTGALAAAAAVLATRQSQPDAVASGEKEATSAQGGGYRVTEHVLRYYQTAKV